MLERLKRLRQLWSLSAQTGPVPPSAKMNPAYRSILSLSVPGPLWTGANYRAFAEEGYVGNADVFACVNLIAEACKGIPWQVYSGKDKKRVEEHPLAKLMGRPNPMQGGGSFIETVVAFFQLSGNTYILRNGPSDTRPPTELWPLRPDRTKVHITGDAANPIDGYNYGPDSGNYAAQFFGQDRINSKLVQKVLHIKTFHPTNDWYGLSPIQAAARNVDHSNAIQAWNVSLLQNACRPSGLLSLTNGELSDVQYEEAKDRLNVEKSGPSNAGKSLILTGDWKWQSMSLSPAELDWGEGDNATTRKICTAFGVPPELLGLMVKTGLNDSNFVQARRKFYMEKILPTLDHFRDDFNNWLSPMFGDGIWLDYDRDQIEAIQEDRQIVWDSNIAAVKASVLTPNEARKKLGYPEIDGGNELLVPTNVVPMGALLAGIASPPKPALAAVQG